MDSAKPSKYIVITRQGIHSYGFCSDDAELVTIGFFLIDDCRGDGIEWYRKWFLDTTQDETGGNITGLKKTGSAIELTWEADDTGDTRISLSAPEFARMLDVWEKIEITYPPAIRITLENGKVLIEPLNSIVP
jgi:hypothetical protein